MLKEMKKAVPLFCSHEHIFPKQTQTETYHVPMEEYNARDIQGGTEFED
jgi:hypothetical protein